VISLWGETQLVQDLFVSKNGDIYIPNVGLINVNGLDMKQLRQKLFNRLSKVYSSLLPNASGEARTHLNVSTGQLRSVKIYVLGEVKKPGGYTLPALSSAFTALYYSGGPDINGSMRNIEVLRDGKVVDHIDLYDYLINGDQSKDIRLNDGDIVFVPPVGKRVAIRGSVFRPAIYELKKGETLGDLLKYASGLTFNAYFQTVHIDRVIPFDQRADYENNILSIDLPFSSVSALDSSKFKLDDGDVVTIDTVNNRPQNMVNISGDVRQPGIYELTSGMTVRDLISKADSVFPDAFMGDAILVRTLPSEKKEMLSFNLGKALAGNPSDNLSLANLDSIHIFKDTTFFPTRWVQIFGNVRHPGTYHKCPRICFDLMRINVWFVHPALLMATPTSFHP
jgi:protein involved in polysaccharide export with SLBB domain